MRTTIQLIIFVVAVTVIAGMAFNTRSEGEDAVAVTGECLREVMPDRASIILTAEFLAPKAAEASAKVNEQYTAFKQEIEALKIPELRLDTNEFSVAEDFTYEKNKQVSRGYRARMGLKVKTSDNSRMSEIIGIAAKQGIQNVGSLESYISQERMKSEYEACLGDALKNAQSKASNLAKIGDRELGDLRRVLETGGGNGGGGDPVAQFSNFRMKGAQAAAMADESGGQPAFSASARMIKVHVSAEYELD